VFLQPSERDGNPFVNGMGASSADARIRSYSTQFFLSFSFLEPVGSPNHSKSPPRPLCQCLGDSLPRTWYTYPDRNVPAIVLGVSQMMIMSNVNALFVEQYDGLYQCNARRKSRWACNFLAPGKCNARHRNVTAFFSAAVSKGKTNS
jgi:hypothetical protein